METQWGVFSSVTQVVSAAKEAFHMYRKSEFTRKKTADSSYSRRLT